MVENILLYYAYIIIYIIVRQGDNDEDRSGTGEIMRPVFYIGKTSTFLSTSCGPSKARAADGRGVCRSGFCGGGIVSRLIDKGRTANHFEGCCRHRLFRLHGLCSAYKTFAKYTQDVARIVKRKNHITFSLLSNKSNNNCTYI